MKKIAITFLFALIVFAVNAQDKATRSVAAAVESFKKAMIDADSVMLNKLTDRDLLYGHSGGKVEDRTSFIANLLNGNSDFVTIDLSNQTILVKNKTAIVHHILSATNNDGGKPGTVKLAILTAWIKEGKDWKLVARQAVKV